MKIETAEQRERRLVVKRASYQRNRSANAAYSRVYQAANKEKIAERMRAWREKNFDRVRARERSYTQINHELIRARWESRPAERAFTHARDRAKQRGIAFELSRPDIYERVRRGRCELTGILFLDAIGTVKDRAFYAPSIDRIDSTKGYTLDNVRIVLSGLNIMMNTWGADKIHELSDALRRHASKAN